MRAPGIAAIVLGAVIAVSGTLGVTYRSEAATLDVPVAADSGSSSPAAPAPDSGTPLAGGAPTPTPTPAPADSATPSYAPTPADSGTPNDVFAPMLQSFGFFAAEAQNPSYSFLQPNSAQAQFALAEGADSGGISYVPADPADGEDIRSGDPICTVDSETPIRSCPLGFDTDPGYGLWHLAALQFAGSETLSQEDAYVYIPPAPTLNIVNSEGGTDFEGTGIAGDTVDVFDSSGEDVCADNTVNDDGNWYCYPAVGVAFTGSFTARQIDSGDNAADGILAEGLTLTPGGISLSSSRLSFFPAVTHSFGAATVTVTSTPGAGNSGTKTEFSQWTTRAGDGTPYSSFEDYQRTSWCPTGDEGDGDYIPDNNVCRLTGLTAGSYEMYSYQDAADGAIDEWFHIPNTPSITSTKVSGTSVNLTGTGDPGDPGDAAHVIVDGSIPACDGVVAANGAWNCTVTGLGTGSHSFQAFLEDTGAGDPSVYADYAHYVSGGLSAGSVATTAVLKSTTASATPTPSPTPTPTDYSNWFFSVTGEDLTNVHPGDTFTVTGSGLPPGATVSGELHSKAISIGSAVVQPDGTFVLPVVVPADFPAGAHELVMTLTPSGSTAVSSTQPMTVKAASSGTATNPTPTPSDSASPLGSSEGPGIDNHGPNSNILTHGLNSIADVLAHPAKIPAALEIGLVLLIFAVLPGHLLNATLAEQYERFNARRSKRRRAAGPWWTRLAAFLSRAPFLAGLALTTVTALLFGFADPRFGFSIASLRLFLGLAIALAIVSYLVNAVTSRLMRGHWRVDVEVNLRPLGLILTVVGVVVSRLLDFSPGFLIGLVLGLVISEKHLAKHAWRAVLLRTGLLLGLALLAWLAFSLFDAKEEGGTFASELAVETLVAITTEAIVGLLVELLPLRLLEGEKLYEKNKVLWGALYLVAIFIFVVAVVPWEGNWAQLGSSLWTWIGIVVGFGILATAIYIFFRVRSRDEVEHHIDKDADGDELVPIGSEDA